MTRPACDHLLQFYENEEFLYNRVAEFLADGLKLGQPLVVIATETHGKGLIGALRALGLNPEALRALGRLVLLDARETLAIFMGDRLPDEGRFATHVGGVIAKAARRAAHNGVRAYGEMVDVLWRDGNPDGAIRLEQCWNTLAQTQAFTLLSAYGMERFATESQRDRFSEICTLQGGTIAASNQGVGHGSTYTTTGLPRAQAQARSTRSSPVQSEVPRTGGLRILVVDDNTDAADSMAMLLQFHGHDTRIANDGVQAVTTAESFRPHVVLLDIGLPRMNGHEAACEIRRQPWAKQTALIAMSGWGQDADRQRSRDAGFDHHLVKPVDHDVLGHLLATVEPAAMGSA
jgi:CheY-like chemotaxis protein